MNRKETTRFLGDLLDLKPCPFCGCELVANEEIWRNAATGRTGKVTVYSHPYRNCILDYFRYHFYAHPHDIEKWNKRTPKEGSEEK